MIGGRLSVGLRPVSHRPVRQAPHPIGLGEDGRKSEADRVQAMSLDELTRYVLDSTSDAKVMGPADMTRRLIVALDGFHASADRWSLIHAVLAVAVLALTTALVITAVT